MAEPQQLHVITHDTEVKFSVSVSLKFSPPVRDHSTCLFKTQLDERVPSGENAIASCRRAEFSNIETER